MRLNIFRSWLATADTAKKLQQTQLRLILDNISLPVSTKSTVYSAVIESWTNALLALDHLIGGTPLRIQDGAVLLGLSAWHIYPDITISGEGNQHVKQSDPLVQPGGIITIGLENKSEDTDQGIYWSLPLAYVRYYGDPVVETCRTGVGQSRVEIDDFLLVVLGSVFSSWGMFDLSFDVPLGLVVDLFTVSNDDQLPSSTIGWTRLLATSAARVLGMTGTARQQSDRLISFGQRRCSKFLAPLDSHPSPVFGLTDISTILASHVDAESKVKFLRSWALGSLKGNPYLYSGVIRYRNQRTEVFKCTSITILGARGKKRFRNKEDLEPVYPVWTTEDSGGELPLWGIGRSLTSSLVV